LLFQRQPVLISIGLPTVLAFSFNFPRYFHTNSGKVYFEEGQSYLLSNRYSPLRSILNKLCSWNSVIKCSRNLSVSPVMLFFFFFLWRIRPSALFSFRFHRKLWILQTGDTTPWTGDQPVATSIPTQGNTSREKTHTSISRVGFEPTIPVFKRAKTVHTLYPAVTVIRMFFHFMSYLLVDYNEFCG
jgi:hypothetical protein